MARDRIPSKTSRQEDEAVQYKHLGASGLIVSQIGLGTNAFGGRADQETSIQIIHAALDHGVTLLDTANGYCGGESERIIGQALRDRRNQVVLSTKAGLPVREGVYGHGTSRRHLMQELEASLQRLDTDYIDLYYVHTFDPNTPLEETLSTLDQMVKSGKVRYVAASNYEAWELMKALGLSQRLNLVSFVGIQTSYSLADRTPERDLVPLVSDQGLGIVAYYPLAGGILSGKYRDNKIPPGSRVERNPGFARRLDRARIELSETVARLAEECEVTPVALALRWLVERPQVSSAIVGATRVDQMEQNLNALAINYGADIEKKLDQATLGFIDGPRFGWYRLDS